MFRSPPSTKLFNPLLYCTVDHSNRTVRIVQYSNGSVQRRGLLHSLSGHVSLFSPFIFAEGTVHFYTVAVAKDDR